MLCYIYYGFFTPRGRYCYGHPCLNADFFLIFVLPLTLLVGFVLAYTLHHRHYLLTQFAVFLAGAGLVLFELLTH